MKVKRMDWRSKLVILIIKVLSKLPLSVVRLLALSLAECLYWIPNSQKRVVQQNIQAAYPQLTPSERKSLIKRNLQETAKATFELGAMWCWPKNKLLDLIENIQGLELLEAQQAKRKGLIFITPHMGSWELVGPFVANQFDATFLFKPPHLKGLESFMTQSRGRFGANLAPTDARGVKQLLVALKRNQTTVILPDQDPGASSGVHAPFFQRPARTMTLLSKLIDKSDCGYLFVVMKRRPGLGAGFDLIFLPADSAIKSQDGTVAAAALNKGVEACIALAPEQYLWSYKRFRKPPRGFDDIYKR
jgi:KDO2-lipid IV(A) lauroyltransferase